MCTSCYHIQELIQYNLSFYITILYILIILRFIYQPVNTLPYIEHFFETLLIYLRISIVSSVNSKVITVRKESVSDMEYPLCPKSPFLVYGKY